MGHKIEDIKLGKGELPSPEESDFIMECMMTHYIMQNQVIKTKLRHVQSATRQRMKEIEKNTVGQELSTKLQDLKNTQKLDGLWDKLISLLHEIGLTEDDIKSIEDTVTATPKTIRKYYDALVEQDRELSNLIYEMNSDTFKSAHSKAGKMTTQIQKRPNTMSGLLPREYEPEKEHIISTSGFEIITLPNLRERR